MSKPSMPGIITSRTSRSGRRRRACCIASRPSVAVATSKPTKRRLAESSSTMLGSSSTTSNRASGLAVATRTTSWSISLRREPATSLDVDCELPGNAAGRSIASFTANLERAGRWLAGGRHWTMDGRWRLAGFGYRTADLAGPPDRAARRGPAADPGTADGPDPVGGAQLRAGPAGPPAPHRRLHLVLVDDHPYLADHPR